MSSLKNLKRKYGETKFSKKSKAASSWSQGKFLSRQNKVIKMGSGPEQKVLDTPAATYLADTVGSVTLLNSVAQGTDFNQCLGRKYNITQVQVAGYVTAEDTTTFPNKVKVLVIYDEQPNAGTPVITDFFTASSSVAFMNLNNRDRFKVIAEWEEYIGGINNTATQSYAMGACGANVKIFRKCNLPVIRNGASTGGAAANLATGALWLVTIGAVASSNSSNCNLAARIRFSDA